MGNCQIKKYTSKVFTKDARGCTWMHYLCDITNQDTLEITLKWKKTIDENSSFEKEALSLLVQNKINLVSEEKISNFRKENGFYNFFKTNAKTGLGVDE